jgi:hypothetical protein
MMNKSPIFSHHIELDFSLLGIGTEEDVLI